MFRATRDQLLGTRVEDMSPALQRNGHPSSELGRQFIERALVEGQVSFEWQHQRTDSTLFDAEVTLTPVEVQDRRLVFGLVGDIGDRKRLEAQFLQAQKMEAVGRLAGGIAHDFNNVLTAITGYCDLVGARLIEGPVDTVAQDELKQGLDGIARAADRAAGLTRQLLAFSRRQVLEPKNLDLNALVRNLGRMLQRLIGEDADTRLLLDPQGGTVFADPGQMEQVLINLAVNARDAMPRGGRLTIETSNADLDEPVSKDLYEVPAGQYVCVAVSDTGMGMSREILSHIFEPFFTTKDRGKGTGLGLATVYGIVKQSGGFISVYSEPGHGSTFRIYLPRGGDASAGTSAGVVETPEGGRETIWLVEDDEAVRGLLERVLSGRGCRVVSASDPTGAEQAFANVGGEVDLLITDVVMPGMNGRQLAERLTTRAPALKVLYVSGYTENAIVHAGVLDAGINFLAKPARRQRCCARCDAFSMRRHVCRCLPGYRPHALFGHHRPQARHTSHICRNVLTEKHFLTITVNRPTPPVFERFPASLP
jgi:signal transduction histidine kinase/CheY-like chemotaxis protein